MTTRADRIEKITNAIEPFGRYVERGVDGSRPGVWAARLADENVWRMANEILDAVLPQITTAEQVKALPDGTTLMFPVHDGVWFVDCRGGQLEAIASGGRSEEPDWYLSRYGPLTVVWQPDQETRTDA